DESTRRERPHDRDLHTAVARMSDWGTGQGLPALAMDEEKWQQLVLKHMPDRDNSAYVNEVIRLVSGEESVRSRLKKVETDSESMEWIQTLLDLATNIWNNTPQPDKGGRSANEMVGL
ncbi:MAG TPA: hypothetical protein VHS06_11705, partial [Chloroflexota bacterium]|nr:hypothetical protein [Chloroflexota bacterium]